MGRLFAIALNTFREAVRDRILYGILFFAIAFLLFILVLGELSLNKEERVLLDVGIAGISLFAVVIAVFLGVSLLFKEIEKKTLYTVLSKPVRRFEFMLGKFLGLVGTLGVQVLLMGIVLGALLVLKDVPVRAQLGWSLTLVFLEVTLVSSVALFFSSFSTPFVSGVLTLGVFVTGRLLDALGELGHRGSAELRTVIDGIVAVAPNFYLYSPGYHTLAVSEPGMEPFAYVAKVAVYTLVYAAILLGLASAIFARRDLV
ncbi:MAG: ABC transporter permease subunit [Deltaproteobacteria bacterium]|nr:ABC transporter permease subunit [Deltaproteobacteria bacterium]